MKSYNTLVLIAVFVLITAVLGTAIGCSSNAGFTGGSPELSPTEEEMLDMINDHRSDMGLSPLAPDPRLNEIAQDQASTQAEDANVEHTDDDNGLVGDRADDIGYNYVTIAENVGSASGVGEMFDDWLENAETRAIIESTQYTEIGLGVSYVLNQHYWTTVFARPQ